MKAGSLGRLRLVLAGLVALVTAAVAWNIRRPVPESPASPTSGDVQQGDQAEGVDLCRLDGSSEKWCLKAKQEYGREEGRRDWRDGVVFTTTYKISGMTDELTIRSERCLFQPTPLEARFEGDVEVKTGKGIAVETDSILYRGEEEKAVSEERVVFRRKKLSGSATGMLFDARNSRLELTADVSLILDDSLRGPLHVTGRQAVFDGVDETWQITDDVVVEQSNTRLTAGWLIADFNVLEGRLRGLLALSDVVVHSDGAILQSGGIGAPPGSYSIRGPRLQVRMRDDGSPAEILAGHGGAEIMMIPSRGRPDERRRIEAAGFVAFRLDAKGRVEEVEARKDVVYQVEWHEPPATGGGQARQRLECKWMVVRMDPETGAIREGEFDRQVVFEDQGRRATANNAQYLDSTLHFTGRPVLQSDDGSRLRASRIAVGTGESAGNLRAMGDVRHVIDRKEEGLLGAEGMKISAADFVYDARMRRAQYQGGTYLKSGSDVIRASEIVLSGESPRRRIQAKGEVHSRFRDRAGAENGKRIDVKSREMVYEEADARITYTGDVEFTRDELVTRTSEMLFMDLDKSGALSSVTAQGEKVEIVNKDRTVQGRKAVFNPQNNTLVIRGDPVVLRDSTNESRGPSLTLDLKTDRVVMDGLNEQRTILKVGSRSKDKTSPNERPR
ncbi:MAG: LPS export ABC transporter periplasmic protein LptC [Vicinamibacteria bacterium]|nr:LPS export ABC transporter periplasmic protein LptC [Vicinamibacteria bacterium]